ncbi:MAG: hypothetical protein ACSLE3_05400 [Microbacteriaceae bacterium]
MNTITRRIAAGFALAAAPAVIALGAATGSQAQATAVTNTGPATTQIAAAHQSHTAQPGVQALRHRHHHHGYYR